MQRRSSRAWLAAVMTGGLITAALATALTGLAAAAPPAGYRCGKGGKPDPRAEGCTCPAGKRAARGPGDVAVCAARPTRPPAAAVPSPPPPPEPTCPSDMVPIPGGVFVMGSPFGGGDPDEIAMPKGKRTVTLSGFCLDRTEVTVEAYAECVGAGVCTPAADTVEWDGLDDATRALWNDARLCNADRDDRQAHPVNCVTWDQATAYCASRHKRLPTEAEWEYAARGSDGRTYPWEPAQGPPAPTLFNGCDRDCQALGKRLGQRWRTMFVASDHHEATAPVGSYPDGASPFGALDLTGNVWEWTADEYARYQAGAVTDPAPAVTAAPADDKKFSLRGGGWDIDDRAYARAANRLGSKRSVRSSSNGFRCLRTPSVSEGPT